MPWKGTRLVIGDGPELPRLKTQFPDAVYAGFRFGEDLARHLAASDVIARYPTIAAAAPQIASYLVNDLGASLTAAGLFYLTNLTAPVAGYLVGARSDRTGGRLGLFRACAVAGFVSWAAIAFSTHLWMPYVLSAVIGGFGGAATSQLFAAIHDETSAHPNPNNDGVVAVVRMALTAGWVVGPVAGSFLVARTFRASAYSGERYHSRARSMLANSRMMMRSGAQSPSTGSTAPPRAR